jgi:glycosyltransferase involved in cell wall biosynthesis
VKSVALFVDRFPVLSETFVVNEVRALSRLGHEVAVEARRRPDGPELPLPPGLPVHYVTDESRGDRLRALAWLAATHPVRSAADALSRLFRARPDRGPRTRRIAVRARRVAGMKPVHVHTHFAWGVADDAYRVARLLGVPTSLTAHARDIYLRRAQLRERLVRAEFVTSGCDYTVAELKRVMGAEHSDKAFRQVMGIDHDAFRRSTPLPATRHVAAVGRLVEKKGFVYLVRAAGQLPDVSISIAGDGPEREALEAEIARLGVGSRVTLLGAADPDEVRRLLETADIFCMPCVVAEDGDRDSMPVVVKEAMAMELCVVATDEVGLPEIVRPPFGELVPPRDPIALARAIEKMLALGPVARREAGAAARRFVIEHADIMEETRKLSGWIESSDR